MGKTLFIRFVRNARIKFHTIENGKMGYLFVIGVENIRKNTSTIRTVFIKAGVEEKCLQIL